MPDRQRGGDLLIPALALAFTLYYFWSIFDAPWTAKVSTYFIGSILILLAVAVIGKTLYAARRSDSGLSMAALATPRALLPRRLGLLALTIGYIVTLRWGGFTLTTLVFLFLAMWLLGGSKRMALLLASIYALSGYVLFIVLFQTRFPQGPFERLLQGVW